MWPFAGLAFGAVVGAGISLIGLPLLRHGRPAAKAVLKTALAVMHEAEIRAAEIVEASEDLYAEAKAEVTAEAFAAAVAAAQAKMREAAAPAPARAGEQEAMPLAPAARPRSSAKAARKRAPVKRSRAPRSRHG